MISIEQSVKGKTAFVTGGTMGIGKATVKLFCEYGINVVTVGRSVHLGEELSNEINKKNGGKCVFYECDVSNTERHKEVIDLTAKQFGHLDILVNCAGYCPFQVPIDKTSVEDCKKLIDVNLTAYILGSKFALPYLRKSKGNIVNIGSVLGTVGDEGSAVYCATKGGITSMTKAFAIDEARNGVRVNEIKPGHICTEMFEETCRLIGERKEEFEEYSDTIQWLGRGGRPEEVAAAILFMASNWASFITGASLLVSGGFELGEGRKAHHPFLPWDGVEIK